MKFFVFEILDADSKIVRKVESSALGIKAPENSHWQRNKIWREFENEHLVYMQNPNLG